eukprot:CAMPEP_0195011484 /NCGR_PEP_ID=MMETSP0326_2-20130528/10995_1 /TAXON_ID=2866 ORGANISM="Crypthecodinium cohnii, Strain Seligo" /NCGR_SAMPLE_ID=MMETSP0326_2 /ASSEMBLY_ACC=CAM_ASM_000348 /LENGTH=117 /DNA_ID=CAMNT_0040020627 /DNA_START=116 /DNA_END=466 /DNA_ORIENTATION=+
MGAKCCTDRRKKDKNGIYEGPNAPIYMPDPILEERATTKDDEALNIQAQLHGSVGGDGVIIGIIGEKTLQSPTTKVREACELKRLPTHDENHSCQTLSVLGWTFDGNSCRPSARRSW